MRHPILLSRYLGCLMEFYESLSMYRTKIFSKSSNF
jgi:hypothetical protein